jgi:hypothetical protein
MLKKLLATGDPERIIMTYRELLQQLQQLNEEQLDTDVAVYDYCEDEFFQASVGLIFADEDCQVLDVNHPIIRF